MTVRVPHNRRNIRTTGEVVAGEAVRGPTWQAGAHLNNWINGRGPQLVPHYSPNVTLTTVTYLFAYRMKGYYQTIERKWTIQANAVQDPETLTVTPPVGAAQTIYVQPGTNAPTVDAIQEQLTTQTAAEGELVLTVQPSGAVTIMAIGCEALARPTLATDTNDRGVNITHMNPGSPVSAGNLANIIKTTSDDDTGRRASILQWAVPYSAGGSTTTAFAASTTTDSPSWAQVFELPCPVLARKIGRSATTGTITMKVLHWSSDGASTTGTVRMLSSVNGASTGVAIGGSTTPAWSSADTATVDCDDLSAADGRLNGAWDELDIEFNRGAGSGTLYIASVAIWED